MGEIKKKLPLSHKGSKNLKEYLREALCFRVLVAKKMNDESSLISFQTSRNSQINLRDFFSDLN